MKHLASALLCAATASAGWAENTVLQGVTRISPETTAEIMRQMMAPDTPAIVWDQNQTTMRQLGDLTQWWKDFETLNLEDYTPPVITMPIVDTGTPLDLQALKQGTVVPYSELRNSPLSQEMLDSLALGGTARLDLDRFGITGLPDQPINPFLLFDENGNFEGIGTPPPGVSSEQYQRSARKARRDARPVAAEVGDTDVSSLNHMILTALTQVCNTALRPVELTVKASGGWNLGFEARAEVTAKIDVDRSCAQWAALMEGDAVADADN